MSRSNSDTATEDLDRFRPLMFSIAYRMVSEVGDAEDIVQEAFLRAHRATLDGTEIRAPKAFLTEVTTRLSIDHLRSARVRRERYVGQWLPEPILTDDTEPDTAERVEDLETLSMAFLVVLDSLSPVERAVFLLHDVFAFGFDEIARIVGKSAENCRQIAVRARKHVEARRPRFEASPERRNELVMRFLAAIGSGDLDALVALLAEDVEMVGDGGGHGAVREPVEGRVRVARFLLGLARYGERLDMRIEPATVNGQPGLVSYDADGHVANVLSVDVADDRIVAIRSVVNPEKLRHLQERAG
jgi:RNA polymerase sigma-70 factor, ECF subfamily